MRQEVTNQERPLLVGGVRSQAYEGNTYHQEQRNAPAMPPPVCMHYTSSSLLDPPNPITLYLIGAGSTGTQVLTALAKMNLAMNKLGQPGLQVTGWDDDTVSEANLGR